MGRPIRQLKDGRWVQGFDAGGDSADSTKWGDASQIDVSGNTGSGGAGADFGGVNLTSFMGGREDTGLIDSGGGYIAPNSYPGGQDAYNKMLEDLAAEEAAKKANTANNTATLNSYEGLSDYFGGDAATSAFNQAQGFDYLNSPYATGLVAMPGQPTPYQFDPNPKPRTAPTAALTPEQLAAQGRANLAAAAARKVTPLTDEQLINRIRTSTVA